MPFCIQRCTILAARKIPGTRCRVVSVNEGAGTVMEFDGDASLALKELGWKAELGLTDMCEDSWRWISNNPNGYN